MSSGGYSPEKSPIWHPYATAPFPGPPPVRFTRASGAHVFDETGKRYFDATSSWWCITHGHCHPKLAEALAVQARTLDHVMLSPHAHGPALELAGKLVDKVGPPFAKVFYSDDGSTAVETALKLSVQYWHNKGRPGRNRFVSIDLAYHGDTLGAMSVSGISQYHHFFDSLKVQTYRAPAPYCYRCSIGESFFECRVKCLESFEATLDAHRDEIAALIVEPLVMGAAGMVVYPREYLEKLVGLCRSRGILVIYDEVFTGFGRTGTFFAMDQMPVTARPDIICMSKGLTAGMLPLAATLVSRELYEEFAGPDRAFYHGHTFTGNPLGAAVALASLELFETDRVLERNERLIAIMRREADRFRALPHVGEVRHLGMIWAAELVMDKASKRKPSPENGPGWRVAKKLWDEGIWLRPLHNTVYCLPPYATTESDLQHFFEVLYSCLSSESYFQE